MRLALLADIHANLHALEAVLRDVDGCGVDELVVLGDTINYGPRPRECLELVSARASVVLAGNHEKEAALPMPGTSSSRDAREMLEWTVSQLAGSAPWETMRRTLLADANACAR